MDALDAGKKNFRGDLNTKPNNVLSGGVAFLILGSPFFVWAHPFGIWLAAACLGLFIALNWDFFRFVWRSRGTIFLLKTMAMHWLYYLYSGIGLVVGSLIFLRDRRAR